MKGIQFSCAVMAFACWGTAAQAGLFEKPSGPLVERAIDRAAQAAVDQWIASLDQAPRYDQVAHVGVVGLGADGRSYTTLLTDALSRNPRVRVVVLDGADWAAIEQLVATTDPEEGWGDIYDKASLLWKEEREGYSLPGTALAADALLMGRVRSVDTDNWINPKVQLNLRLVTADTREIIAGGMVEGESHLHWKDALVYYKVEVLIIVGLLYVLWRWRRFMNGMRRPR